MIDIMKRTILFALAVVAGCMGMHAQEVEFKPSHSIEVTLGEPLWTLFWVGQFHHAKYCPPHFDDYVQESPIQYVDDGNKPLPSLNIRYNYKILPHLTLGADMGWDMLWRDCEIKVNHKPFIQSIHSLHIMFSMRWDWFNVPRKNLQMYSSLAVGPDFFITSGDLWSVKKRNYEFQPMLAFQMTLFGFRVMPKEHWYWDMELGVGAEGFFNTGFGYKF